MWRYDLADWEQILQQMSNINWSFMLVLSSSSAVTWLTSQLKECMAEHIPLFKKTYRKATHPWVSWKVRDAVLRKCSGHLCPKEARCACSDILFNAHKQYTLRMRQRLRGVQRGSKQWWLLSKKVTGNARTTLSVPGLRSFGGVYIRGPQLKANMFATALAGKYSLPDAQTNRFSQPEVIPQIMPRWFVPSTYLAKMQLLALDTSSATGPDDIPATFLKRCAEVLGQPLAIICQLILETGEWPSSWRLHRIFPLYKKGAKSDCSNYRGLHLTSHLSKIVERMLKIAFQPLLQHPVFVGVNQFAYLKKRGARDAVAYLFLKFIEALAVSKQIGLYKADVSGAFDRVNAERLLLKLQCKGLPQTYLNVIRSWLVKREAYIELAGCSSNIFDLENMVFQGTVLGPILWNTFFQDCELAFTETKHTGVLYADDLQAFKFYERGVSHEAIIQDCQTCRDAVHKWGAANQVVFDPLKEGLHVLSLLNNVESNFCFLGCRVDSRLQMQLLLEDLVLSSRWKVASLLRVRCYHSLAEMVNLYKAQLLGFIEYRTAAIYHAGACHLEALDDVQKMFLEGVGLKSEDALLFYNLAPLCTRRDIAMLGLLHRSALRFGPPHFAEFFKRDPLTRLMHNPYAVAPYTIGPYRRCSAILTNSALGLILVYNSLSMMEREAESVADFQSLLQEYIKSQCRIGLARWERSLCPRCFGQ